MDVLTPHAQYPWHRPAARALLGLLVVAVLAAVFAGAASADGGPHGGFSPTGDSCAGCHRTHVATAPGLLTTANTALCLTCHGAAGTGATTDVADGIYTGTGLGTHGAGLNGGGFTNALEDTALTGNPTTGPVTSVHNVQGMPRYSAANVMWGAGAVSATPSAGQPFDLYCTSCHDPHGSANYRTLRATVNGQTVSVPQTDEQAKSYTSPTYYNPTPTAGQWAISSFCAACHTRYQATAGGSGSTPVAGDPIFTYRHRNDVQSGASVNGVAYPFPPPGTLTPSPTPTGTPTPVLNLPVSTTGGPPSTSPDNRTMTCLTCHYAHGTEAKMGANSGAAPWPGAATTGTPTATATPTVGPSPTPGGSPTLAPLPSGNGRSSLLRLDNSGVCESCHAK